MAIHDCDIVTYTNDLLARLIYPVANANFPIRSPKAITRGWAATS